MQKLKHGPKCGKPSPQFVCADPSDLLDAHPWPGTQRWPFCNLISPWDPTLVLGGKPYASYPFLCQMLKEAYAELWTTASETGHKCW
jgi:hypothetical protein